ncbi:hypothetical protein RJ639_009004 [Escallonia herrerae]|uniref:Pectinesterase inhibitor domain-containing protein n=1 Tax=Escallonia herrerae TaxID=1293975 RepID=A0AA88VS39_9ASTE|nr:hypothetical protein RJ639_009004 [Escallonia herrerae]
MASSSLGSSSVVKVYLHVVILSIGLAGCSVVTRLCLKTPDPKFCLSAIASSNPETDIDDLEILGVISIDSALANTTATLQFLQELVGFVPNVRDKARLRRCAKLYAYAIEILQESNEDYKKGHYQDVIFKVSFAYHAIQYCEDSFGRLRSTVNLLSGPNHDLELLILIVSIINQELKD